jgi:hypothetical protein
VKHSNRAGSFTIRNSVEYFIAFFWRANGYFYWMAISQAVRGKYITILVGDKCCPHI